MDSRKKRLLLGVWFILWLALAIGLYRAISDARAFARRAACAHNLKLLALPLYMYAEKHDGQFPDNLSELYAAASPRDRDYLTGILICPEVDAKYKWKHGFWTPGRPQTLLAEQTPEEISSLSSYALVPDLSLSDDKDTIIAYEKEDNHSGAGRSILYLDGRALSIALENQTGRSESWQGG